MAKKLLVSVLLIFVVLFGVFAETKQYNILMYVGNNANRGGNANDSLNAPMTALENYWESLESLNGEDCEINVEHVRTQDELKNLENLMNYSLVIVSFPDDFGTNNSEIQTIANNLLAYTDAGGCLVMFGESNSVTEWKKGNINLTKLSKQMGITISYGDDVPGSNAGGDMTVNTQADLCNVYNNKVEKLYGYYIPYILLGDGTNTIQNTQIVATYTGSDNKIYNSITDTKVGNGYITFLTDINMWMGKAWLAQGTTLPEAYYDQNAKKYPVSNYDTKKFLQNLLRRSISNIETVSSMNSISYSGLDGAHYEYDSDGNELANPNKYSSSTESFTLINPIKEGVEFVGWSGTDINGFSKSVTVAKGSSGDRTYTANWHEHVWKYEVDGYHLNAYCIADNLNSDCCSYNGKENAVSVYLMTNRKAEMDLKLLPSTYDKDNLVWASSDTNVLTVDQNGFIEGKAVGTATVTVSTLGGTGASDSVNVTIAN